MRAIKVYCPPGVEPPLYAFIDALDGKLKAKLLWQIFRLRNLSACELKEPHFKHFSLERYSQMYELREKGKVLIRIVFTVQNEDVILLMSFIKRQPRDRGAFYMETSILSAYSKNECQKYFDYLERLRQSGETNMYGAVPYLQEEFPELRYSPERARKILLAWFGTFREKEADTKC